MINWKSILSVYDDKVTLLEYLKKVQKALNEATLEKVVTKQDSAGNVTLSFVFSDETKVETVFTIPVLTTISSLELDSNEVVYSQEHGAAFTSGVSFIYKKGDPTIGELTLLLPLIGEKGINIDADEAGKKLVIRLDETAGFLKKSDMKTIFGNQTLYGSGNIDLFLHNIEMTGVNAPYDAVYARIVVVSSKNLVVDSLTDLKTLLGETFIYPATGFDGCNLGFVNRINENGILSVTTDGANRLAGFANITKFTDTVTTI